MNGFKLYKEIQIISVAKINIHLDLNNFVNWWKAKEIKLHVVHKQNLTL